ncbi:MAG: hypothetical protein FJX65_13760 [Alphaproteobacteria bacterium]|nr:hypothetical protein [Alphaproteobacteria bacterium]
MREKFPAGRPDFVGIEYHIARKILDQELIAWQPPGARFFGITMNLIEQKLVHHEDRTFDQPHVAVGCWSGPHLRAFKEEFESGLASGQLDIAEHEQKRQAAQIRYERTFWFDITKVFGAA